MWISVIITYFILVLIVSIIKATNDTTVSVATYGSAESIDEDDKNIF